MLAGKPSREDEAVTVDAIKSILADYENEFDAPAQERNPQPMVDAEPIPNLAPVAVVEDKVARPKYTSVPNLEQNSAVKRPVQSKMSDCTSVQHGVADTAVSQPAAATPKKQKKRFQLPALSLPSLSLPKIAMSKDVATPVEDATKEQPMPMLREAEEQTRVSNADLTLSKIRAEITPRRLAWAVPILCVVIWPATVFFLVVLTVFLTVGLFVFVGADKLWDSVARFAKSYADKHPERKDAIYDKLDDIAVMWDNLLDRFPEGTVDGLYMPDFSNIEELERQHDAKVTDRLNQLQSQG